MHSLLIWIVIELWLKRVCIYLLLLSLLVLRYYLVLFKQPLEPLLHVHLRKHLIVPLYLIPILLWLPDLNLISKHLPEHSICIFTSYSDSLMISLSSFIAILKVLFSYFI